MVNPLKYPKSKRSHAGLRFYQAPPLDGNYLFHTLGIEGKIVAPGTGIVDLDGIGGFNVYDSGGEAMANQGAKKRKDENQRHMTILFRLIIICNAVYILLRLLILHSSFTWKHWIGLLVTSAAYAFPYYQLANMAEPSYDENGELLDGGFDMSTGGVCGYFHDVIYITSFVQLTSIISDKFWYIYLVIPAFAAYKLYDVSKGWFQSSPVESEDAKARRKREKMERKASRTKFVKTRNR